MIFSTVYHDILMGKQPHDRNARMAKNLLGYSDFSKQRFQSKFCNNQHKVIVDNKIFFSLSPINIRSHYQGMLVDKPYWIWESLSG